MRWLWRRVRCFGLGVAALLCGGLEHRAAWADDSGVDSEYEKELAERAEAERAEAERAEDEDEEEAKRAALQPGWQLSLFAGYGDNILHVTSYPETGASDKNPLGLGLGLRARYQLPIGLLFGLRFSHHLGAPMDEVEMSFGQVEGGWAVPLGPLRLELFFSGGLQRIWRPTAELCHVDWGCTPIEQEPFSLALGPGLAIVLPFAERYFVGVSGEVMAAPDIVCPSAYASLGLSL